VGATFAEMQSESTLAEGEVVGARIATSPVSNDRCELLLSVAFLEVTDQRFHPRLLPEELRTFVLIIGGSTALSVLAKS
jgi:hypothetical protein